MQKYLDTQFDMDSIDLASAYDEVAIWSFPFGEMIFDNLRMRPHMTGLDIGFGTGYPILELADRLGKRPPCTVSIYGRPERQGLNSRRARLVSRT
jgi:arsenite methyltransferase